jgi:hypothetical protein
MTEPTKRKRRARGEGAISKRKNGGWTGVLDLAGRTASANGSSSTLGHALRSRRSSPTSAASWRKAG